jgi:GntR family transcriptional regulator, histidine utilization repressor
VSTPAYRRIKDFIVERIHAGEWKEGDQIPSEHVLAREFRVSRMTANRALRELTADQVTTRVQGAGTFVARPKYESTLVKIRSIAAEIASRGHQHTSDVLDMARCPVEPALALELGVRRGARVFHSLLLHRENGTPVQIEDRWVSPSVAPEYGRQDFHHSTPNEYLMRVAPLQRVEYRIEACSPDAVTRRRLDMIAGEPCLLLHRRTWSRGQVASVVDCWHPGNRYRFTGHF